MSETAEGRILAAIFRLGNNPQNLGGIASAAGVDVADAERVLLKLHRLGQIDGKQVIGLKIPPKPKGTETEWLFEVERRPAKREVREAAKRSRAE